MGEEPHTFTHETVLWLHSQAELEAAFGRAGLRYESIMIEQLRCWKLSKRLRRPMRTRSTAG